MERETDSTYPNNPFDYHKPPAQDRPPVMDPMKDVFRMPWPRKPMSDKTPKGKSNSGFARTGIHFGPRHKKRH
jgi:hypothetical protein